MFCGVKQEDVQHSDDYFDCHECVILNHVCGAWKMIMDRMSEI